MTALRALHGLLLATVCVACGNRKPDAETRVPHLPDSLFAYSNVRNPLPRHFIFDATGSAMRDDDTPSENPVTDAGATLGRVLFYDSRLSRDGTISCASCHQQRFAFSDSARFSRGVGGTRTRRHSMALVNARFRRYGRYFRDERAATLEEQTLQPIHDSREMGLSPAELVAGLEAAPYYPSLFAEAWGTPEITADRVARSLAQFVRSLVSYHARLDSVFRGGGPPDVSWLTPEEQEGRDLFNGRAGCARCHRTNALSGDVATNIGLDSVSVDSGAGGGRFRAPSLRNVAVRPPYMHDGRFRTLEEIVDFYDRGVRDNPHLDPRLRGLDNRPLRLGLSPRQRAALVAYLGTFTDQAFLSDERYSDPFGRR